ncbi:MAG: hypothetical protein COS90_10425 [Deltaproteobacteria bacterium CG07_land_8_20_14_0_80_60_11]|nr:MAG: hypothetical protein COS90_10425 [Deltaproteobacteria bacterium CG07_land_8_20_14_0_80_60_11]
MIFQNNLDQHDIFALVPKLCSEKFLKHRLKTCATRSFHVLRVGPRPMQNCLEKFLKHRLKTCATGLFIILREPKAHE